MTNDEVRMQDTFQRYREACQEVEPSSNFMPVLWQKIESRQSFLSVFERLGGMAMAASAALCLVLLALTIAVPPSSLSVPTYTDALMADHSVERTYYAEAIRSNVPGDTNLEPDR